MVSRFVRSCGCAAMEICVLAMAQQAPAGTQISIRLKSGVSTRRSKPADPAEAVIIAPVGVKGRTVIGSGAVVRGSVEKVAQSRPPGERAALLLRFTGLEAGGARQAIVALVAGRRARQPSGADSEPASGASQSTPIGGSLSTT